MSLSSPLAVKQTVPTKYCPSCDKYTRWGWLYCENEHRDHYTYMGEGKYRFDASMIENYCGGACDIIFPDDDGVSCCFPTMIHHDLWVLLVKAMEKEAEGGVLTVANWAPTFPRRTAELVEVIRKAAAAALADKLPVVLVGIVSAYLV